jgi:hypothetical protein
MGWRNQRLEVWIEKLLIAENHAQNLACRQNRDAGEFRLGKNSTPSDGSRHTAIIPAKALVGCPLTLRPTFTCFHFIFFGRQLDARGTWQGKVAVDSL